MPVPTDTPSTVQEYFPSLVMGPTLLEVAEAESKTRLPVIVVVALATTVFVTGGGVEDQPFIQLVLDKRQEGTGWRRKRPPESGGSVCRAT